MIFAAFVPEYQLATWAHLPYFIESWIQIAGAISSFALLIWGVSRLISALTDQEAAKRLLRNPLDWFLVRIPSDGSDGLGFTWGKRHAFMLLAAMLSACAYIVFFMLAVGGNEELRNTLFTVAATLALVVVLTPPVSALFGRFRCARIWGLARLSIKEALRRRVVYVFGIIGVLFLFAGWFLPSKPEDQLRSYVDFVHIAVFLLFVLVAALLGSFSIPTDVKNQTIHTITTKPVERFEIVLGRFFGYGIILTMALAVLTGLSLLYIMRGVDPRAAEESYKARVSLFAPNFQFFGTSGENVGRVWDYRRYISGPDPTKPNQPTKYAIWSFPELPSFFAEDKAPVRFEHTFDIFRVSKHGAVSVQMTFVDGKSYLTDGEFDVRKLEAAVAAMQKVKGDLVKQNKSNDEIRTALFEQFGIHIEKAIPVRDYHTGMLDVPSSYFKALQSRREKAATESDGDQPPDLRVLVNVEQPEQKLRYTQMVGVARHDLYIVASEYPFWLNFLKGFTGVWLTSLVVLGISVACSAYLSGVISLLCTIFLCIAGLNAGFIQQVATNQAKLGGPVESMVRVLKGRPMPRFEESTATSVIEGTDAAFRWLLRVFMNILPDLNRYDLHGYVANGFNISIVDNLFLNGLLPILAYLLPWAVLAYYLIQYREIANPS